LPPRRLLSFALPLILLALVGSAAHEARAPAAVATSDGTVEPGRPAAHSWTSGLQLRLEPVAGGFDGPVFLTGAGDGSGDRRLEADGSIDPEPVLDITDKVLHHGERGLLGLAVHPGFRDDGRLFVTYSRRTDGATVVSEFGTPVEPGTPAEPVTPARIEATERPLLVLPQRFTTHKGGMLAFDRGGRLVISTGDGGSGNDPLRNGLDRRSLLGKLLRIDVDAGRPYAVPSDNGFAADPEARAEVHAIGLRNPWRFSVDRASGDLYIGDVGQSGWEEIDVLPLGRRDASFGWSDMEGPDCLADRACRPGDHLPPAVAYRHREADLEHCGVIGGYAYRGASGTLPQGTYLYGDHCSGVIWSVPVVELAAGTAVPSIAGRLAPAYGRLQSFGEDDDGELYLITSGGTILHVLGSAATPR
jgi:glucose/arabinose dehydrogenase